MKKLGESEDSQVSPIVQKKDEVSTSGAAGAFATPMAFQRKTLTPKKTKKIKN